MRVIFPSRIIAVRHACGRKLHHQRFVHSQCRRHAHCVDPGYGQRQRQPAIGRFVGDRHDRRTSASISPTSLTFAAQNVLTTSAAKNITLTNNGSAALSLNSIVASGDYAQTNNCGSSLAASLSCTIQVTFSPSAAARAPAMSPSAIMLHRRCKPYADRHGHGSDNHGSILPIQASVTPGQSAQFQAFISGVSSTSVTWAVDGITGGNSTIGTISTSGLYTGPSTAGSHTVTATSTANTTQAASVPLVVTNYAGTYVYHNDNGRTGQNLNETVLTTGNVNVAQFGKIFTYPVDGQIYAEPLYVEGVSVAGQGTHNVVYVATENDSLYAFDADGAVTTPLWQLSLIPAGAQVLNDADIGGCSNISPQVGITSTPVIDPVTNTIFLVARSKITTGGITSYYQYLHSIDITSGIERSGSPVAFRLRFLPRSTARSPSTRKCRTSAPDYSWTTAWSTSRGDRTATSCPTTDG